MTPKSFLASKTLWLNLASVAVVVVGAVLDASGVLNLTTRDAAIGTIVLAGLNALLRIFATSQPLSVGSSVPSVRTSTPP